MGDTEYLPKLSTYNSILKKGNYQRVEGFNLIKNNNTFVKKAFLQTLGKLVHKLHL